ncbi:MAG: hypothetical protein AAF632_18040 [Bacteroidota bacterium]
MALATENDLFLWLESSLRIKRSLGLQRAVPRRDKSDKTDAIRISESGADAYAFRYADQAILWQPEREILLKLRQLVGLRKRLLNAGHPMPKMR